MLADAAPVDVASVDVAPVDVAPADVVPAGPGTGAAVGTVAVAAGTAVAVAGIAAVPVAAGEGEVGADPDVAVGTDLDSHQEDCAPVARTRRPGRRSGPRVGRKKIALCKKNASTTVAQETTVKELYKSQVSISQVGTAMRR